MARRPKRSALVLAIAFVAFCQLVHYRCVASGIGSPVSSGEADAAADLDAAESNHRALLNLPKFGDRLAPRNRPNVEDIGPGVSERAVVGSVSGRQARGPTVYGGRVQSVGSGYHPPAHPIAPTDNDIKRSDVMMVSSRSVQGAGVRAGPQDLADEDEEEVGEEEEEDGEEEVEVDEEPAAPKGGESESGDDYFAIDATHNKEESLGRSSIRSSDQLAQNRLDGSRDNGGASDAMVVVQQQPESVGRSAAGINIAGISNASSAQAHRLEMSTEFFVVPSTASSAASRSTTIRPGGVILAARHPAAATSSTTRQNVTPPTVVSTVNGYPGGLRKEPWVVPVLVLASLSMLMMAAFEVFVLCKAWRTSPSRRHLFLGQMLLLGLFACSGLAAVLTVNPTVLSCATMRFGAGVAFALVFASLLVKCVFLISLNGGVYLPAPYQGLLLLFAVLIQVAVGGQWLLTSPPSVDNVPVGSVGASGGTAVSSRYHLLLTAGDLAATASPTIPLCHTPFAELLLSLIYIVFLIVFVAILAIKSRGIRDNYREATYIGLAIGGIIPIWLGWTLCGLAVADRHRDACLAFGLVATSSTVFLVMFMPKGRQLAAMGKEGLYVEDREERFSSLSRAGSGYSPSFFHFKPIKYGVMGPSPTLQAASGNLVGTTAATTTTKHHQAVATLGG
uniref:G-protein coupled receptors family 3 profile domain-containing protein n=1 Tax=Anopheles christyi TaxID=43041 RepID=A0A182KF49_9DIPT